ncbi:sugar ABC transporter substrate-binding protein [Streptomyces sp. NPDC004610]|uniref:ABC transporter substrate-binding protein n=1 Tax=unclassified Streptomyces TaxID=2593676 RepID=UPI0033A52C1B
MSSALPGRVPSPARRHVLRGAAALAALGAGAGAASAAPLAPPLPDLTGVTLRILVNSPHIAMHRTVLAPAWQQLTGGTVEVTSTDYLRLTDRIIDDVRSGTAAFDLFDYYYYGLGAMAEAGALVDLTGWIRSRRDLDTQDFLPSIHDPYTLYRGRRYGLPYDGDQHLVFYNRELLDAHGVRPPATWDEFDSVAERITRAGGGAYHGAVLQRQPHAMGLGCCFINRLVGYGGDLVDRSGRPTLTTDAAVAAARQLIEVAPHSLPVPPEQPSFDPATNAFLGGQLGLIESWTGLARRADDPALSKIAGKWGAVALPLGGHNRRRRTPLNGGYALGVSSVSPQREAALAYIAWATAKDTMLTETTQKNSAIDPNRRSVLHSAAYGETTPTAVGLIRAGLDGTPVVWPKGPDDPGNLQRLADELALAVAGGQTATRALRNAQAAWRH